MWYTVNKDTTYCFELQRGVLGSSPIVEETIGPFLLSGLANVEHLTGILRRHGLDAAANYFAAHVASRDNIRIGDFGEVVAGHVLEEAEGVVRPIEKLRYRESPGWPMKLTDVFCVQVDGGRIVGFVFGEAKTGTTAPNSALGQNAYRQLYRDLEDEEPQILFFTLDKLLDANDHQAYFQLDEAMHKTEPVPRALRMVFIFDAASWKEDILSELDDALTSDELVLADDFRVYLLSRDALRDLITASYAEAERMAAHG